MMKILQHFTLFGVLISTAVSSNDKLETHYDYLYDNNGFAAHQTNNTLKTEYVDVKHVYYDAYDNNRQYSYNHVNITTSFVGDSWSVVVGPGLISSDQGNTAPSYMFIGDYQPSKNSNIELAVERSPLMSAGNMLNQVDNIADYVSDNITLSGEYQLNSDTNISAGILTQEISDGNNKRGVFAKISYQFNDNWGIQYRNSSIFTDYSTNEYFSPNEFIRNWTLISYTREIADGVGLKLNVGPGVTTIDNESEITWLVESKLVGKLSQTVKLEARVNCSSSVFDYEYCMVGAQTNISF